MLSPFFPSEERLMLMSEWLKATTCMTRATNTHSNRYNKTMCTLQVYSRFNCSFKRIPAFRLLLFCYFVAWLCRAAMDFFVVPVANMVIVYTLSLSLLRQRKRRRHHHYWSWSSSGDRCVAFLHVITRGCCFG